MLSVFTLHFLINILIQTFSEDAVWEKVWRTREDIYARYSEHKEEYIRGVKLLKLTMHCNIVKCTRSNHWATNFLLFLISYVWDCFFLLFAGKKKTLQVFILKESTVFSFPSLLRRLHLWLEAGPLAHQFKHFKTGIFWSALIQVTCPHQASIYLNVTTRLFRITGMSFWNVIYTTHYMLYDVQPRHGIADDSY